MKQFDLVCKGVKLVLKEHVLAVLSDAPLSIVSSSFHNGGGLKKTNVILNVEVPKSYGDRNLHDDPDAFIVNAAKEFGVKSSFIGVVTAAAVANYALVSKSNGEFAVSVVATAADNEGNTCNFSESSGEPIELKHIEGTINIIVVVDGNPTEGCLVGLIITATEAKMAALKELDIRSRFSGDEATGTVTDAIVVAETRRGAPIVYGGPASRLGQLVGYCTRKAVKEAITKANEFMPYRSIKERLRERHISIEKIASELSKVNDLKVDTQMLAKILGTEPLFASLILAAVKMDADIQKELRPSEFGNIDAVSERFGSLLSETSNGAKIPTGPKVKNNYDSVDLPPFTKHALINIVRSA